MEARHRKQIGALLFGSVVVIACVAPEPSGPTVPPTSPTHAAASDLRTTPSPIQTSSPTTGPTPLATAVEFSVTIAGEADRQRVVRFMDFTGGLTGVRQSTQAERRLMGLRDEQIWVATLPTDHANLYVHWDGGICDVEYVVQVNPIPPEIVVSGAPRQSCDLAGWSTSVVMTFDGLVDGERVTAELIEGPVMPRS